VFALLVHLGVVLCGHQLGDTAMAGMAMSAGAPMDACPILVVAALTSALCALLALCTLALSGIRAVVAVLAEFLAVLLAPGASAPWLGRPALVPVRAGVRVARRRPSRAPPTRI
jgi:hypothetical protein